MNIYVANIPFKASEDELRELFAQHGDVSSVKIILDKETNRSRGFGFVEMADSESAKNAINELNGYSFLGKELVVNEARPKSDTPRSGGAVETAEAVDMAIAAVAAEAVEVTTKDGKRHSSNLRPSKEGFFIS